MPSDAGPTLPRMAKRPTRIDLLELDIDLRLADLWREAAEIGEWNLEVVAAFMRALAPLTPFRGIPEPGNTRRKDACGLRQGTAVEPPPKVHRVTALALRR
jgi:hypothetical protein